MHPQIRHKTLARWLPLPGSRGAVQRLERRHQAMRKLAHDLRNPLNSILLMAQLLEEVGGTPDSERIAKRILRQCEEMSRMINLAMEDIPG